MIRFLAFYHKENGKRANRDAAPEATAALEAPADEVQNAVVIRRHSPADAHVLGQRGHGGKLRQVDDHIATGLAHGFVPPCRTAKREAPAQGRKPPS